METIITPDPLICVHVSVNHFISIHANRVWPSPPLPRWPLLRPLARRAHGHTYRRDMRGDKGPSGRCSCLPCSNNPHRLSRRTDPRSSLSQEGRRGQRAGTRLHVAPAASLMNHPPPSRDGRPSWARQLSQLCSRCSQGRPGPRFPGPRPCLAVLSCVQAAALPGQVAPTAGSAVERGQGSPLPGERPTVPLRTSEQSLPSGYVTEFPQRNDTRSTHFILIIHVLNG